MLDENRLIPFVDLEQGETFRCYSAPKQVFMKIETGYSKDVVRDKIRKSKISMNQYECNCIAMIEVDDIEVKRGDLYFIDPSEIVEKFEIVFVL